MSTSTTNTYEISEASLETIAEALRLYISWNSGMARVAITQNLYEESSRRIIDVHNAQRVATDLNINLNKGEEQ